MGMVKVNIVYGEDDFRELFQAIVKEKKNTIIYNIKNNENIRYNKEVYLSTEEMITEVENDE